MKGLTNTRLCCIFLFLVTVLYPFCLTRSDCSHLHRGSQQLFYFSGRPVSLQSLICSHLSLCFFFSLNFHVCFCNSLLTASTSHIHFLHLAAQRCFLCLQFHVTVCCSLWCWGCSGLLYNHTDSVFSISVSSVRLKLCCPEWLRCEIQGFLQETFFLLLCFLCCCFHCCLTFFTFCLVDSWQWGISHVVSFLFLLW